MVNKICAICKASKESGVTLFTAPVDRRGAWSGILGFPVTKATLICGKHFQEKDFTEKRNKLKVSAMPSQLLSAESFSSLDMLASCQIKTEPQEPELVLVNESTEDITACGSASLGIDVKTETPIELVPEPFVFIHEERFDEHNSNASGGMRNVRSAKSPLADTLNRRTCGRIEMLINEENESFKLNCNYCEEEFEISDCLDFIKHIKTEHVPKKRDVEEKPEPIIAADVSAVNDESSNENVEQDITADSTDNETDEEPTESLARSAEPKNKKARLVLRKKDDKFISFDHTSKRCVTHFLELLKSNAILWHRRQSVMKRYDEALTEIAKEFNAKWPQHRMNEEQFRQSINRIKDLYQRVADPTHKRHIKNSVHKTKYPEYFELCAAIEENSKKVINSCDHCRAFFFSEVDLQIHKVKMHRIGELPFKCQKCGYGFSKADKLAEHQQRHNNVKSFSCTHCKISFYSESKLQAHMVIHTDDYKPICEVCGEKFSNQYKYRRHKLRHEAPKEKCDICGKLYFEKWNLSEHIKSHRNERHYECDICGKTFNHQNGVTIHKRGVHGVKPIPRKYVWVDKDEAANIAGATDRTSAEQMSFDVAQNSQGAESNTGDDGTNYDDDANAINNTSSMDSSSFSGTSESVNREVKPRIPLEILSTLFS